MSYVHMKQNFISSCRRIPTLCHYISTLFVVLAVVVFWYYFVQVYMQNVLILQDFEYQQLQEQYATQQRALADYDTTYNQIHSLFYQAQQIKQMSYDDVIFSIMDVAHKHSLVCTHYRYDKNIQRQWYDKKQVSFQVRGDIKNINAFLQYMHKVPELISCNSLLVSKYNKEYELMCVMRYAKIKPLQLVLKS